MKKHSDLKRLQAEKRFLIQVLDLYCEDDALLEHGANIRLAQVLEEIHQIIHGPQLFLREVVGTDFRPFTMQVKRISDMLDEEEHFRQLKNWMDDHHQQLRDFGHRHMMRAKRELIHTRPMNTGE